MLKTLSRHAASFWHLKKKQQQLDLQTPMDENHTMCASPSSQRHRRDIGRGTAMHKTGKRRKECGVTWGSAKSASDKRYILARCKANDSSKKCTAEPFRNQDLFESLTQAGKKLVSKRKES